MINVSGVSAVLVDIEGTTSSIAFVHDVLFPYAREHLADYVRANADQLTAILDDVRAEAATPSLDLEGVIATLLRWIEEDRKATPLKTLQGMIWRKGYEAGMIKGHIYSDAVASLQNWRNAGLQLYVYSSGSVEAQKLIFGHSEYGDITPWFSGFFDTTTGAKQDAGSYINIAVATGLMPRSILFLSDHPSETAAARRAGMQTVRLARPGDKEQLEKAQPQAFASDEAAAELTISSFRDLGPSVRD